MEVSAAIITNGSEVLCFQKGKAKHDYLTNRFEFPGGKLEPSESPEQALARELKEELNYDVSGKHLTFYKDIDYDYSDFSVKLHYFIIHDPNPIFVLKEHIDAQWHSIDNLEELNWAGAHPPPPGGADSNCLNRLPFPTRHRMKPRIQRCFITIVLTGSRF